MTPIRLSSLIAALCLTCAGLGAAERTLYDLPPMVDGLPASDPAWHFGTLDNGLRWVVRSHPEPAGKVSLRLLINAGSLDEQDPERGLAHFLEHMAFKGSTHFPDNSLIDTLQAMGVSHGAHSNAHTSFDETVYKLDLPDAEPETLDTGLTWFQDVLHGLSLDPESVITERGVILAEMRDRDSVGLRAAKTHYAARYPGLRLATHWPIGIAETVQAADAERLRGFWQRWYRPDNAVVVVVGDIDAALAERRIAALLGPVPAPEEGLTAHPDIGVLPTADVRPLISIHHEEEVGSIAMRIDRIAAGDEPEPSPERAQAGLLAGLGERIVGRRLDRLAEDPQSAILGGGIGGWWSYDLRHGAGSVRVREGRTAEALTLLIMEVRRFLKHGPSQEELDLAVAETRAALRQAVATADNRASSGLANAGYWAAQSGEPLHDPSTRQALLEPWLATASTESVRRAVAAWWEDGVREVVAVTAPGPVDAEALRAAWESAMSAPVPPPADEALPPWPYAPADEAIAPEVDRMVAHDIRHLRWANGVAAAVVQRDAKPQEVLLQIRIGREPAAAPAGVRRLAARSFLARGTGSLTRPQIEDHLAPTNVALGVSIEDDAVVLSGSCLPDEVPFWLAYACGLITDPGWRNDPIERARLAWIEGLVAEEQDLDAQIGRRFTAQLTGGVPDRTPPMRAVVETLDATAVQAWLAPILARGSMEVAVVGDIDAATVVDALGATVGTLPARASLRLIPDLAAPEALAPAAPIPALVDTFAVDGAVARAVLVMAWPTDDMADIREVRRYGLLADVMALRLRDELRTVMGDAYSPYAGHQASAVFDGFGYLQAYTAVAPERVDDARAAMVRVAQTLAENGVSDEEFTQVHTPALRSLPTWRERNAYWLGSVAGQSWSQPERLDWAEHMVADFESITVQDLNRLAAVLASEPLIVIGVSPGREE